MTTELDAITGRENPSSLDDRLAAIAEFYRAFNTRDLTLMERNWTRSGEAVMDNPVGGIRRGWAEIRSVYEQIFRSNARVEVEFYDYSIASADDMFYAAGRERGRLTSPTTTLDLAIRTTRVFRRVEGRWRQIHHHGSIDDPQRLAAYQDAVR